jgi:hypothetical protein
LFQDSFNIPLITIEFFEYNEAYFLDTLLLGRGLLIGLPNKIVAEKFSIRTVLEKRSYLVILVILTLDGSNLGGAGKMIQRPTKSCFMKFC